MKHGKCPSILQQPHGKEIPIAVFGGAPYIILNKEKELIGGVELQIMDIYANKFGFTPKYIMVSMAGQFDKEGGMVDMVRNGLSFNPFCTANFSVQQVKKKYSEIGIGQAAYAHFRYQLIEYLPRMFDYRFVVQSKKPEAIVSFDALTYPFDKYIWYFTSSFSLAVFALLILIQKCWVHASRKKPPYGWVFEGKSLLNLRLTFPFCMPFFRSFACSHLRC